METVLATAVPRFLQQLAADYRLWAEVGARRCSTPLLTASAAALLLSEHALQCSDGGVRAWWWGRMGQGGVGL